jgi:hypothetical protein
MAELEQRLRSYWGDVVATHPLPSARDLMDRGESTGYVAPPLVRIPSRRRLVLVAVAAVVAAVVAAALVSARDDGAESGFASTDSVAASFIHAWVRGDGEALAAMHAPGATFDGVDASELPARHEWYRAAGWRYRSTGCEITARTVECDATVETDLTRVLGRAPIAASLLVAVDDGRITLGSEEFDVDAYSDIWEGFLAWVSDRSTADVDLMYSEDGSRPRLDATSIARWRAYVGEYVDAAAPYVQHNETVCAAPHASLADALADLRATPPPEPLRLLVERAYDRLAALAAATDPSDRADRAADIRRRGVGLAWCVEGI